MDKKLKETLSKIKFKIETKNFSIISIPEGQFDQIESLKNEFFTLTLEKEGVTLIISDKEWNKIKSKFNKYKIESDYKILTYESNTDLNLVGFLASISKILADKNISLNVISAFHRDYFLLKKQDAQKALKELNKFIKEYS